MAAPGLDGSHIADNNMLTLTVQCWDRKAKSCRSNDGDPSRQPLFRAEMMRRSACGDNHRKSCCLVAEHCWDPVGLAIVQHAYRFKHLATMQGRA
jgi:hypothetical protein